MTTEQDNSHLDEVVKRLNSESNIVLQEVSELIKAFNAKSVKELDDDYIRTSVDRLTFIYFMLPASLKEPASFWRARKSEEGQLFEHTNDLAYPPSKITNLARANHQNSSIFYAASSPETAFSECRFNDGDNFHLTSYSVKKDSKFHVLIMGDIDSLRRTSKAVFDSAQRANAYNYVLSRLKDDIRMAVRLVDAFFVDRLSRKGNDDEYKVTASIVSELLKPEEISGIIYPSVEHSGGFNYALKPDCYEHHIVPTETCMATMMNNYGYGMYKNLQSSPVKINTYPGKIVWPEEIRNQINLTGKRK
jgi:hypothetical protein